MTHNPENDARWCPLCDVSLDLHDGPDTCSTATRKADLIAAAGVTFGWSRPRLVPLVRDNGLAGVPCVEHGKDCDGSTSDCEPVLRFSPGVGGDK